MHLKFHSVYLTFVVVWLRTTHSTYHGRLRRFMSLFEYFLLDRIFVLTPKLSVSIRYKSLSSLQLTPDSASTTPISIPSKCQEKSHQLTKSASTQCAREGTLDSSRSGGRTSGDSKLPEKKTRRLSRPRSLSNLVWELRPQKEKSKKKLYVHHYDHHQQGTLYL